MKRLRIPLLAVAASLLIGAIWIGLLGKNPLMAYWNLLQGSGLAPKPNYAAKRSMFTDFMSLVNAWTPMLFAALAVAAALKAGLFNIGVSGQMLVAGFITSITIGYQNGNPWLIKPLVLLVGIVTGGVIGGVIGWLKFRFRINEVVSSIMINYIALYVISFLIQTCYINPVSRQSEAVSKAARLTLDDLSVGGLKMDLPFGFLIAVIAAFILHFMLNRTKLGFELKAVGSASEAARYAGIRVGYRLTLSMVISGSLAGLAGVTYYLGYFASIPPKVLPTTGFDAIAVALLGNGNPFGILLSSLLITILSKGSVYMSSASGLEAEMSSVITALILLFCACTAYIEGRIAIGRPKEVTQTAITEERKDEKG